MQQSETTVLGNSTDEHQKAFFELLGAEAIGGFAEAHAEVIVCQWVLKKVDDTEYSGYIKRKLVEWYKLAQKSYRHAYSQEERGEEVDEEGEGKGDGQDA